MLSAVHHLEWSLSVKVGWHMTSCPPGGQAFVPSGTLISDVDIVPGDETLLVPSLIILEAVPVAQTHPLLVTGVGVGVGNMH